MADYKDDGSRSRPGHHWLAHIRAQQKSGLSRAEYCRRNGLSYHAMTYWQRKKSTSSRKTSQLVPVPMEKIRRLGHAATTPGIKIILNDRIGIEVREQFSPGALSQVLAVLEGR